MARWSDGVVPDGMSRMTNARTREPPDREPTPPEGEPARPGPAARIVSPSLTDEDPDVGLSQKGLDEDAVIRRETDI